MELTILGLQKGLCTFNYELAYCDFVSRPFDAIACESLCYAHQIETFRSDYQINLKSATRKKKKEGLEVLRIYAMFDDCSTLSNGWHSK